MVEGLGFGAEGFGFWAPGRGLGVKDFKGLLA